MSEYRPSDRELLDELIERAGVRTPDYADEALRATRTVRQRPAWRFRAAWGLPAAGAGGWRRSTTLRLVLVAALVALVPIILMLGGGGTPAPTAQPGPTLPPVIPTPPAATPPAATPAAVSPAAAPTPDASSAAYAACALGADATLQLEVWDLEEDSDARVVLGLMDAQFEAANPGVDVIREHRDPSAGADVMAALQQQDGPDVAQVPPGADGLGALAATGQLRPLDDAAATYGWTDRWPASVLDRGRATKDGRLGEGDLLGVSSTGWLLGLYFNVDLGAQRPVRPYPLVLADEMADMEAMAQAGHVPLVVAGAEGGLVDLYAQLAVAAGEPGWTRALALGGEDATFATDGALTAARMLLDFADAGYLLEDYALLDATAAQQLFASGTGELLVADSAATRPINGSGTGISPPIFTAFPAARPEISDRVIGGVGMPWAVTAAAANPDCAAAYIDWITGDAAAARLSSLGILPSHSVYRAPEYGTATFQDLTVLFRTAARADRLEYPLDAAFPGARALIDRELERLLAREISPEEFVAGIEAGYRAHVAGAP